jgi:hypothetical protein
VHPHIRIQPKGDDEMPLDTIKKKLSSTRDFWKVAFNTGGSCSTILSKCAWGSFENKNVNDIKEVLTAPDVVSAFKKLGKIGTQFDNIREHALNIINKASNKLPKEEMVPLAKFLANDEVTNIALKDREHDENYKVIYSRVHGTAYNMLGKVVDDPDLRGQLIEALKINDLGRTLIAHTNRPVFEVLYLSKGLAPREFDELLTDTQFFADVPYRDIFKTDLECQKDEIAINLLLSAKPELEEKLNEYRRTKHIGAPFFPPIEDICAPEEALFYTQQARSIIDIALKHCNGEPRQTLDNEHSL